MEKKKFTSSGPRDYMVISGKRLTTYLTLMTRKRPKNKKARSANTDVALKKFVDIIK